MIAKTIVATTLSLASGFSGTMIVLALLQGHPAAALWTVVMFVVYLPMVIMVCRRKGNYFVWRKRMLKAFGAFTTFGVVLGAGLLYLYL